jgi:hypothetical protein
MHIACATFFLLFSFGKMMFELEEFQLQNKTGFSWKQ